MDFVTKSFRKDETLTSWPLLQHICPQFWAWLLLYSAITPKSEDKYAVKVVNWSEFHFSEMTLLQNPYFKRHICLVICHWQPRLQPISKLFQNWSRNFEKGIKIIWNSESRYQDSKYCLTPQFCRDCIFENLLHFFHEEFRLKNFVADWEYDEPFNFNVSNLIKNSIDPCFFKTTQQLTQLTNSTKEFFPQNDSPSGPGITIGLQGISKKMSWEEWSILHIQ